MKDLNTVNHNKFHCGTYVDHMWIRFFMEKFRFHISYFILQTDKTEEFADA